jgi:hypothetical protein
MIEFFALGHQFFENLAFSVAKVRAGAFGLI